MRKVIRGKRNEGTHLIVVGPRKLQWKRNSAGALGPLALQQRLLGEKKENICKVNGLFWFVDWMSNGFSFSFLSLAMESRAYIRLKWKGEF